MIKSIVSFLTHPFSWSKWVDISTFSFGSSAYLLQGKVNKNSNSKKFKVVPLKRFYQTGDIGSIEMSKLEECGLITTKL